MAERLANSRVYYPEEEQLLRTWCNRSQVKAALHRSAAKGYTFKAKWCTCVTLVLQTVCGSASLAVSSGSLPAGYDSAIAVIQLVLACAISIQGYLYVLRTPV